MNGKSRALEEYLVSAAKLGEQAAMHDLVRLRGPRLLVHATRLLGHREEAQDAVQEAWVQIFKGLNGLQDNAAFPAWATRIVTRCCAKIIATKQRGREIERELTPITETACETELFDEAQVLRNAITQLPQGQQVAVALFYLDDMSLAEVSIALDVPIGTVKSRLSLARNALKDRLKGVFDD